MRILTLLGLLFSVVNLTSCVASYPSRISPIPMHSTAYNNSSCSELSDKLNFVTAKLYRSKRLQTNNARWDILKIVTGILFFPFSSPLFFFLDGDGEIYEEIALLKGKERLILEIMDKNKCQNTSSS